MIIKLVNIFNKDMKIQGILVISFFIIIAFTALSATWLTFFLMRDTLEKQINSNLQSEANLLMEQVDLLIFERMQNIQTWSQLEIMQEGRIGDVDKQLSQFLSRLKTGYKGIYTDLHFVGTNQAILASSNPFVIGQNYHSAEQPYQSNFPGGELFFQKAENPTDTLKRLLFRIPVIDRYSNVEIGQLFADFSMIYIDQILDKLSNSATGERHILILDAEGKLIAASIALRSPKFLTSTYFAQWRPATKAAVFTREDASISESPLVVGYATSDKSNGYTRLGWSYLILQNAYQAYLPIEVLWFLFVMITLVTIMVAFSASHYLAKRIASPIQNLTYWVQNYLSFDKKPELALASSSIAEVQQLSQTFANIFSQLELSRDQCVQASKLAVIGEMSAIMAHEVRTPLGILTSAAQCLQRENNLSQTGSEMTQIVLEESIRLNKLVTTLLECASPKAPKLLPQSMHEILKHVHALLRAKVEEKRHVLHWSLLPYDPIIKGDRELLVQALLNLLLNAIQMTPDGGIITISTTTEPGYLVLEIADNGPGIDANDVKRLFDPFFSKRDGGIGLGLTVTQQIIHSHEGSIEATQSALGGAGFILIFPLLKL